MARVFAAAVLVCALSGALSADSLVFSVVVHRHGDRSPTMCFPLDIDPDCSFWTDGFGMLTPTGMQQLHTLGVQMRDRYVTQYGLVGANYTRDDVYVRSTDYDRTLISAQSLLQGLYPPGTGPTAQNGQPGLTSDDLQPIPIHTVPVNEDALLRAWTYSTCEKYGELQNEDQKLPVWEQQLKNNSALFAAIPTILGINATLPNMYAVADPLIAEQAHNYPWPKNLTVKMFNQIVWCANFGLARMFFSRDQRLLTSGVFMDTLYQRLTAVAHGWSQPGWDATSYPASIATKGSRQYLGPRLYLYSAHDTTVAAVLAAMGLFDGNDPTYGASVVFELWNSTDNGLGVRMFYNQGTDASVVFTPEAVITLPTCTDPCPLDKFLKLIEPTRLSMNDWLVKCDLAPPSSSSLSRGGEAAIVGVVCSIICIIVGFFCWKEFRWRRS